MQEITKKVKREALDKFRPLVEQMASEGMDSQQIANAMKNHIDSKIRDYYRPRIKTFGEVFDNVSLTNADSKAEKIFYDLLCSNNIPFQFQYSIGPYRADYLINNSVVVEIDGPQHIKAKDNRRDKYMRDMGYKVIRVPLWVLAQDPVAIIEEIKSIMED